MLKAILDLFGLGPRRGRKRYPRRPQRNLWAEGAAGERALLDHLVRNLQHRGWGFLPSVMYERSRPGAPLDEPWEATSSDIDLVAIGPPGVFIFDAKRATKVWTLTDVEKKAEWMTRQGEYIKDRLADVWHSFPGLALNSYYVHTGVPQPFDWIGPYHVVNNPNSFVHLADPQQWPPVLNPLAVTAIYDLLSLRLRPAVGKVAS